MKNLKKIQQESEKFSIKNEQFKKELKKFSTKK